VSLTHLHGATKLSQVHPIGKRAQLLFTQARRRGILRTSPLRSSPKFAATSNIQATAKITHLGDPLSPLGE
jgi:hypothetical protein